MSLKKHPLGRFFAASISVPARAEPHPHLRPVNPLRDLPQVADLIELCFHKTMDSEGERYLRDLRRSGTSSWMHNIENVSATPLNGFVWEENGKIVGNVSQINFRHNQRKIVMLANVAVHPDYRRRGIARAVTEQAMAHARERGAQEIWLNVRDDNPEALHLYADLGFVERARRTQWTSADAPISAPAPDSVRILPRQAAHWEKQRQWLEQAHPSELNWYRAWNFKGLAPGFWNWLYLLFVDINLRQWSALRGGSLEAVLAWTPGGGRFEPLWLALGPDSAPETATRLLVHARSELGPRRLFLEHPSGPADSAIRAAGFRPERTLIWMRAESATN